MITIAILVYIIASIFAFGGTFGYFQQNPQWQSLTEEEYRTDLAFAVIVGLSGPIGFLVVFFYSGFFQYGMKWK